MTHIRKTLIDIQESKSFEKLEPFKKGTIWTTFGEDEKMLFVRLLLMHGEQQLAQGNIEVLESFEKAAEVSSYSPEVLFQQGKILSSYKENSRCLNLASRAFAHAIKQNPYFFDALFEQARILIQIGMFDSEAACFHEAHEHFKKAFPLLPPLTNLSAEFYAQWGECLALLGKVSGEPIDFQHAIEKFRLAHQHGCAHASFYNKFGHCFADLALLLGNPDYLNEAFLLFEKSIELDSSNFEARFNHACCLQYLSEFNHSIQLMEEAENSFARAADLNPECNLLWLKWAQQEASLGRARRDFSKLHSSLEKFERAYQLDAEHLPVLCAWGTVELFLGVQKENIDFVYSAQEKVVRSLELHPEDSRGWYLYGSCLNELGRYFADTRYFNQAIEKFQYGLSLSRHDPLLWYGMALSHYSMGELTDEKEFFEKSVKYCSKVIEAGGQGFPQFWNDWGVALLKLADMTSQASYAEMAIDKFEKALKQSDQNSDGEDVDLEWVYNYGCAFDLLGDCKGESQYFEKSVHILNQVLEADPGYQQARYNLALSLSHWGESTGELEPFIKALEHFQYLLEVDSEDEVIQLDFGTLLINIGLLVYDPYQPENAQSYYRQAENHLMHAAALGNPQSYYQLACLYSITGLFNQSMHYLERARFSEVLPPLEDLLHDEWLERVQETDEFHQFIIGLSPEVFPEDQEDQL